MINNLPSPVLPPLDYQQIQKPQPPTASGPNPFGLPPTPPGSPDSFSIGNPDDKTSQTMGQIPQMALPAPAPQNGPQPGGPTPPQTPGGKLPEVTVIGPNPSQGNSSYGWKAMTAYAVAIGGIAAGLFYWFKKK